MRPRQQLPRRVWTGVMGRGPGRARALERVRAREGPLSQVQAQALGRVPLRLTRPHPTRRRPRWRPRPVLIRAPMRCTSNSNSRLTKRSNSNNYSIKSNKRLRSNKRRRSRA